MKPMVAFTGSCSGIILCRCGREMTRHDDGLYSCGIPTCEFHGRRYRALVHRTVVFYEVPTP